MAKIGIKPSVLATITLELTEDEAGALDAICGYGAQPFLDIFYSKVGRAYLEKYEKGLRSLFDSVQGGDANMRVFLARADLARQVINGQKIKLAEGGGQ